MSHLAASMAVTLAVLAIGGCRALPLEVEPNAQGSIQDWSSGPHAGASRAALRMPPPKAPPIRCVHARITDAQIEFMVEYHPRWEGPPFDPDRPGGWCFQLFVNTDELETGYAGYDFLARGIEVTPEGSIHVRSTEAGPGPGGWGESLGLVPLTLNSHSLKLAIPLSMIGPDDGRLDFALELYSTEDAGDGQLSYVFVSSYLGRTRRHAPEPIALRHGERLTLGAARVR